MTPFGKGLILGGLWAATILAMKHSGAGGWWVLFVGMLFVILFTAIPDRWIRRG